MNKQEIENYNRLCAEFLKWQKCLTHTFDKYGLCQTVDGYITPFRNTVVSLQILEYNSSIFEYSISDMQFHSDWNWIMIIVEAIEKLYEHPNKEINVDITPGAVEIFQRPYRLNDSDYHEVIYLGDGYINNSKKEAVVQAIGSFFKLYYKNTDILNSNNNTEMLFSMSEVEGSINDCNVEKLLDEYEKQEGSLEEKTWEEIQIIKAALIIGFKAHQELVKHSLPYDYETIKKLQEIGVKVADIAYIYKVEVNAICKILRKK